MTNKTSSRYPTVVDHPRIAFDELGVGRDLVVIPALWRGDVTVKRYWRRNGIRVYRGDRYTVKLADLGTVITLEEVATSLGGKTSTFASESIEMPTYDAFLGDYTPQLLFNNSQSGMYVPLFEDI